MSNNNLLLGIEIFFFVLFFIFFVITIVTGHYESSFMFIISLAILLMAISMNLNNRRSSYSGKWETKYDRLWGGGKY